MLIISLWMSYHDLQVNWRPILPIPSPFLSSILHHFSPGPPGFALLQAGTHLHPIISTLFSTLGGFLILNLCSERCRDAQVYRLHFSRVLYTSGFAFPLNWLLPYLPSSGRIWNYNMTQRSHIDPEDDTHM